MGGRQLAVVYAQVFGLALDTALIQYCDPSSLDYSAVHRNAMRVRRLREHLEPALKKQNEVECSCLSLELVHLLKNCECLLKLILTAMECRGSVEDYFEAVALRQVACKPNCNLTVRYYGGGSVTVQLRLINDIEILFKRLNCVFYCVRAADALEAIDTAVDFLGQVRGVAPVPRPDLYSSTVACTLCHLECTVVPNQGQSIASMLAGVSCSHLCKPVKSEPVAGQFENELQQLGLVIPRSTASSHEQDDEARMLREASLAALDRHTVFESPDAATLELSNLVYWNSGQRQVPATTEGGSAMAELAEREKRLHALRGRMSVLLGEVSNARHFFDIYRPTPLEALFCGGVFSSLDETIDALKKDCASTFLKKANYETIVRRRNELFARLNDVLRRGTADDSTQLVSDVDSTMRVPSNQTESQIWADAGARRDAYVKKITQDGLKRLYDCLENQSTILEGTLCLRVWGSLVYEEAAALKNHFLFRLRFLTLDIWEDCTSENEERFENSKYVKNVLFGHSLSREHLDCLALQFYDAITGPVVRVQSYFPAPENVSLAYCLDAAGVMPHQKVQLTDMIWPSITPKEWIDTTFNNFYTIKANGLSGAHRRAWEYVRELTLSVALYNRAWEKTLKTFLARDFSGLQFEGGGWADGIYFTYEEDRPLVLICAGRGWVFKDLYALLYVHLRCSAEEP